MFKKLTNSRSICMKKVLNLTYSKPFVKKDPNCGLISIYRLCKRCVAESR